MTGWIFVCAAILCVTANPIEQDENLYEGDIVLTPDQRIAVEKGDVQFGSSKFGRWPTTIYYDWAPELANNGGILAAIADYEKYTCLRFKRRLNNEKNYMYFYRGRGCSSGVGYSGRGKHSISIGYGCTGKGTVIHEIGHRLGIWHEQSRPDRDNYVKILYENIRDGMAYNFGKQSYSSVDSLGTPYDFSSVMHYGSRYFSKNGKLTIQTIDPSKQKLIGRRSGFSEIDKQQVNLMYCKTRPTSKPVTTSKPPTSKGFIIKHSGGRCLAVQNNQLILTYKCDTRFEEINGNKLAVVGSDKCAYPRSRHSNSLVYTKPNCGQTFTKTYVQSNGYFAIKHVQTGKCFHPKGGSGYPREGTKIVIYSGCNERRLFFKKL